MDHFSSKTSRSDESKCRKSMGFSMYLLTPRAAAFFADILSLEPVQMITGMCGRISRNSAASLSPVIRGIVMSVMITSNRSGSALNHSTASRGVVVLLT